MNLELLTFLLVLAIELQIIIWLFRRHPRVSSQSSKRSNAPQIFIDSSVLIDGRIAAAVKNGFIPENMLIPSSVLQELQLLADSADSEKRVRARQGMELAKQLQELSPKNVSVYQDEAVTTGVDDRLIELALANGGGICTIDYNLIKRAEAEGIVTLNINELAKTLRMNYLPGDKLSIDIVTKGNDNTQGVGYLADGTMVVVEKAKADIGKTVEIEFIRSIQTAAGRMFFAKKLPKRDNQKPARKNSESTLIETINKQ